MNNFIFLLSINENFQPSVYAEEMTNQQLLNFKTTCIVIPAYNEEKSLPEVLSKIRVLLPEASVVVINDCSNDHTESVLKDEDVTALNLPINLGIGGAVQTGIKYASVNGFEIVVQCDGDGQHRVEEIHKLVEHLIQTESDICIGSRWLSDSRFSSSKSRRAGMKIISTLLKFRHGIIITDPTSGFRAFNLKAIHCFADYYPQVFPEVEVLLLAKASRMKVAEISTPMNPRIYGRSSIGKFKSLYYMTLTISLILIGSSFKGLTHE